MEVYPRTADLQQALITARMLTKAYGSSYYASTLLFPKKMREAVFALYGLVRKADEIVDTAAPGDDDQTEDRLRVFEQSWHDAYAQRYSTDPILYAAAWVFESYAIPFSYSEEFFSAMRADITTHRYATYIDLTTYMHGSAAVIGLMLTRIIGVKSSDAYAPARDLGYAMQLTNFLRDIREDYVDRGRIYLPQEDLDRFNVTEEMIANGIITPEFTELMKFQIARARALYTSADAGIPLLARSGQKPVRLARVLYSKILDRIEEAQYDVFSERRYTTKMQKLRYALPILLSV